MLNHASHHPWSALSALLLGFALAPAVHAASWTNNAGGDWSDPANWSPADVPNAAGETAEINLDGDYTVDANTGVNIDSVTIGATSASGTQTLQLDTFSGFNFGDMTIGANGVFNRAMNGNVGGTGTITVQNGGQLIQSGSTKSLGSHDLTVDVGGLVTVTAGNTLSLTANRTYTINGQVGGDGDLNANANGIIYAGTGVIGGGGVLDLGSSRPSLWRDNLTITRDVIAVSPALRIADGDSITIDGTFTQNGGNRSFGAENANDSASVLGSGDVNINQIDSSGDSLRLGGGGSSINSAATFTFAGTGTLNFNITGSDDVSITATQFNLQRDTTINGSSSGRFVHEGGNDGKIDVTGAGNTLTLASGVYYLENRFFENKVLTVNNGAGLTMAGGSLVGDVSNTDAGEEEVRIGVGSAGVLALTAGATSAFETEAAADGENDDDNLRIVLGANASTTAGANAVLELKSVDFAIAMTNDADWGWDQNATLKFIDVATGNANVARDGRFEALSSDQGNVVDLDALSFVIDTLAFGSDDMTFTLMETTDNDGGGDDSVLYVRTLDLSMLSGGTLDLDGVLGNTVYYLNLINPNNVTLSDGEWVQIVPEPGSLALSALGLLLIARRRRRVA